MSYNTKAKRPVIPTPTTATQELHDLTVARIVAHYQPILGLDLLIGHRSSCYGLIINSTVEGAKLESLLGSTNAKVATEQALEALLGSVSVIPTSATPVAKGGFSA